MFKGQTHSVSSWQISEIDSHLDVFCEQTLNLNFPDGEPGEHKAFPPKHQEEKGHLQLWRQPGKTCLTSHTLSQMEWTSSEMIWSFMKKKKKVISVRL